MSLSRGSKLFFGTVTFAVPVSITLLDVVGYIAKVEGSSMQPVLNPNNDIRNVDYVLLNKWGVRNYRFKRGEVISLRSPSNPEQRLIKRIIALEGDTVRTLHYKNRYVRIPEGHCWVEGDHHGHSLDSNLFGPVSVSLIQAKASHIVWPPSRWQRLKTLETKSISLDPGKSHLRVCVALIRDSIR
ncbi:mitochondrial inner membrane protease subunit 2-like isoform X2 [Lineus longissimus]|uniref:mitochondrial inner membrane protease subunit 2-like isoform X2 n=1 Tax=Lineus longissimus TaxID=88925 RepID=UPI00315D755D